MQYTSTPGSNQTFEHDATTASAPGFLATWSDVAFIGFLSALLGFVLWTLVLKMSCEAFITDYDPATDEGLVAVSSFITIVCPCDECGAMDKRVLVSESHRLSYPRTRGQPPTFYDPSWTALFPQPAVFSLVNLIGTWQGHVFRRYVLDPWLQRDYLSVCLIPGKFWNYLVGILGELPGGIKVGLRPDGTVRYGRGNGGRGSGKAKRARLAAEKEARRQQEETEKALRLQECGNSSSVEKKRTVSTPLFPKVSAHDSQPESSPSRDAADTPAVNDAAPLPAQSVVQQRPRGHPRNTKRPSIEEERAMAPSIAELVVRSQPGKENLQSNNARLPAFSAYTQQLPPSGTPYTNQQSRLEHAATPHFSNTPALTEQAQCMPERPIATPPTQIQPQPQSAVPVMVNQMPRRSLASSQHSPANIANASAHRSQLGDTKRYARQSSRNANVQQVSQGAGRYLNGDSRRDAGAGRGFRGQESRNERGEDHRGWGREGRR